MGMPPPTTGWLTLGYPHPIRVFAKCNPMKIEDRRGGVQDTVYEKVRIVC